MRLENKVAIVVGAGQTPGETIGNGRATAILFAREQFIDLGSVGCQWIFPPSSPIGCDLIGRRREAGEIEIEPAQELVGASVWRREDVGALQVCQNESVDL